MTICPPKLTTAALMLVVACSSASAATFCASTPEEIQTELFSAAANGQGDEIRVQSGVLFPSSVLFYAPSDAFSLEVSGGWNAGCAAQAADPSLTVLDGADARSLFAMNSSAEASLILRNFTIRNGRRANGGAGALVGTLGDLSLIDMRFEDNHHDGSLWYGGGVYVTGARDVVVERSRFERNRSVSGGGIHIASSRDSLIQDSVFDANMHSVLSPNGPHNGSAIIVNGSGTSRLVRNEFTASVMAPLSVNANSVELVDNVVAGTTVHPNIPATSALACGIISGDAIIGGVPDVPGRVLISGNDFTGTQQAGIACLHLNAGDTTGANGSALELVGNTFSGFAGGVIRRAYARAATVTDNLFADSSGETALNLLGRLLIVRRNRFLDLSADSYDRLGLGMKTLGAPAGLLVNSDIESLVVSDNLFVRNQSLQVLDAKADGGAMRIELRCLQGCVTSPTGTVRITNNTFVDNSADLNGGAIAIWSAFNTTPTISLHNNLFWGNGALGLGGDVYVDNDYDDDFIATPTTLIANSLALTNGGYVTKLPTPPPPPGTNYDNVNPLFVDPEADDYRLQSRSPMVDAGDSLAPGQGTTDIIGRARAVGAAIDVGAYESDGTEPVLAVIFSNGFGGVK